MTALEGANGRHCIRQMPYTSFAAGKGLGWADLAIYCLWFFFFSFSFAAAVPAACGKPQDGERSFPYNNPSRLVGVETCCPGTNPHSFGFSDGSLLMAAGGAYLVGRARPLRANAYAHAACWGQMTSLSRPLPVRTPGSFAARNITSGPASDRGGWHHEGAGATPQSTARRGARALVLQRHAHGDPAQYQH